MPRPQPGRSAPRGKRKSQSRIGLPVYAVAAAVSVLLIWLLVASAKRSQPGVSRSASRRTLAATIKDPKGLTADIAAQARAAVSNRQHRPEGLYALSVQQPDGSEQSLAKYAGQVTLVVNVASQCGYTESNYRGLEELRRQFHPRGFEVLAFPCNAFGGQEPGTWEEIQAFAKARNISFPIFPKVDVNGGQESPVFAFLKSSLPGAEGLLKGADVAWNFEKWLCNRAGRPVKRYSSAFDADALRADIEAQLAV